MLLKNLKEQSIKPEKEIIFNKAFIFDGIKMLLASLTYQNNKPVLWMLYNFPQPENELCEHPVFLTKRDMMLNSVKTNVSMPRSFLKDITIGGEKLNISSSGGYRFSYNDHRSVMLM